MKEWAAVPSGTAAFFMQRQARGRCAPALVLAAEDPHRSLAENRTPDKLAAAPLRQCPGFPCSLCSFRGGSFLRLRNQRARRPRPPFRKSATLKRCPILSSYPVISTPAISSPINSDHINSGPTYPVYPLRHCAVFASMSMIGTLSPSGTLSFSLR